MSACVKEEPVTIEFASAEYNLLVGEKMDFMKEVVISNTDDKPVFAVTDEELATITPEGMLTALKDGRVTVNAELAGLHASCDVIIGKVQADTVIINAPKALTVDSVRSVTVTVKPESYDKENLKWEFSVSDPSLKYEATKENAGEYKVKFTNFIVGGKLVVKVSDNLSGKSQTSEIEVVESGIPATKLELIGVDRQTETLTTAVKLIVEPADYDPSHLDWTFEPTSEDLGFTYTKISDLEYNVSFASYVRGGSVTIMATDRLSSTFAQKTIEVLAMPEGGLTKLQLSPEELTLFTGDEPYELDLISEPEAYDPLLLVWTSSDEKVATVKDGVITPVGEGKATITVKDTVSEKEASCVLTVAEAADGDVRRIELPQEQMYLTMKVGGESVQLLATCYDADGNEVPNYANLEWSAVEAENADGKYKVVEVSQRGVVTPKQDGTTVITVVNKQLTSVKAICNVTVVPGEIKVKEVKLSHESKCIAPGKTFQIEAKVLPVEAEDKTLEYSSANTEVATVSETGLVTAVKKGSTYIRVTSANGVYGECEVIVDDTWVEFGADRITLVKGEERVLNAKVFPENIDGGTMTWSSSAPEVVSVTQDGKVKGLSAGEAEIKVETSKGISGALKVTVMNDFVVSFNLLDDIKNKGVHQFESFTLSASYSGDYVPASTAWISSDPSALKLTEVDGVVTVEAIYDQKIAKDGAYPVTITHKVANKEMALEINILPAKPTKVVVGALPENNVLYLGETFDFKISVEPWQAPQDITATGSLWFEQSTNAWHGTTITPTHAGEFEIFFAATGSVGIQTQTYNFTVKHKPVDGGQLSRNTLSLEEGSIARLSVTLSPANNPNYDNTLVWESSNPDVASVEDGLVTAHSTGSAEISVMLSNGKKLICEVTVIPQIPSDIAVGDYYYSDGSVSHELDASDASKKVIGVVFYVGNPTNMGDLKLPVDHPDCTHGFVVSTAEYLTAHSLDRSWSRADLVTWMNDNGFTQILSKDAACGYSNTLGYDALNKAGVMSYDDQIRVDVCGKVADHAASVEAPALSTGWYLPSLQEMKMLHENMQKVNESLSAADGKPIAKTYINKIEYSDGRVVTEEKDQYYWHSTFHSDNFYAFNMNQGNTDISTRESSELPVRIILAF